MVKLVNSYRHTLRNDGLRRLLSRLERVLDEILLNRGVVSEAVDNAFNGVENFRLIAQHSCPLVANRPASLGPAALLRSPATGSDS